jgi:hypothetical protein
VRWWWISASILVCVALAAIALRTALPASTPPPTVRGVRLGMTAEQVRSRFEQGAPASWRTEVSGSDVALVRGPGGSLDREARFELHSGMLVAVRLDLPAAAPEAQGAPLETTPGSVIARDAASGGRVRFRLIARDCPVHAAEVAAILGR